MTKLRNHLVLVALALSPAFAAEVSAQDLVISELMAINDSTVRDEDGNFTDWLEIFNAGDATVNVGGYYLTDDELDLTKWRLPPVDVPPGGFLLVFASDKDRRDPGSELHANFKLSGAGEFLALVAPDGFTPVWKYDPFPPQVGDFSYGLSQNATVLPLVRAGAPARTLIPSNGTLGLRWTEPDFDDSGWIGGSTGVGYDENSTYRPLIETNVDSQMNGANTTAYIRVPFTVGDPSGVGGLVLRMKYDDGFAAYINGTLVAQRNAPGGLAWDSSATGLHDDGDAVVFEEFSVAATPGLLRAGENVLAIHGLNDNLGSSDFVIVPELDGTDSGELDRTTRQFFPQPSPGGGNLPGFPGISPTPAFSVPGSVFSGALSLVLSVNSPGAEIRYTLDGSEPDESSTLYTGPIRLTTSTVVRAQSFRDGFAPSPPVSEGYLALTSETRGFDSNLPVVLVDNFGSGSVPANSFQPSFVAIFEPQDGRTRLADPPRLQSRSGIKIRGSSTQNRPKKSYNVEFWDEKNEDKDLAPLGLPEESDWILYGAYNFDLALLRNAFIYDLSNQVGRYAVRTRFCEVFVNTGGGSMSMSDYAGVYSFMEKIKRGDDRVDVKRLTASHDREPEITGGYMLKIDRLDPGDSGFNAGGRTIAYVDPKEDFITPAQATWIKDHIDEFVGVLNGPNFTHPALGYERYIDVGSWIEHHILNVYAFNVDALRLSTYFFKDRGEKIEYGPIWDFDRSMGSTDGRDDNPRVWSAGGGTDFFNYPWWDRLFDDPDFFQAWIDGWTDLRRGPLSTGNVDFTIDRLANEIGVEAATRNFQRWTLISPSQWPSEVNRVKQYLLARSSWIDSQFMRPPRLSSPGRNIQPGFELTISAPTGSIYFTLDGTDPRGDGGVIAGGADLYEGAITLEENARVVARARAGGNWSGVTAATYVVETPRFVITELMYHPLEPVVASPYRDEDFEFIELMNATNRPLDIRGMHFTSGVEFTFPSMVLDPGELVVVVSNLEAFAERYDTSRIRVAGEYEGNLANNGETVGLSGPLEEPIHLFAYSDLWFPETDGDGTSLTLIDPFDSLRGWGDAERWLPSSVLLGTPGDVDPGITGLGGRQRLGDSNQDGFLDVADGISILVRLFGSSAAPLPCDGESLQEGGNRILLDLNGDEGVDIADAVHLLRFLFTGGSPPAGGTGCVRIEGCPSACRL